MTERLDVALHLGLPGFTLDVEWTAGGGVTVLLGRSDAGKTLTLRCLAGLARPDRGRIVVGDRVLFDSSTGVDLGGEERRIGHVLPGDAPRPGLSPERSAPGRWRAALGRALAADPELLLLDEPLAGLDRPTRESLREELRSILIGRRTVAVIATDDFAEAYRLADRIVVYDQGRVVKAAPPAELLWGPAAEAVARIVGIRNICRGEVLKAAPDRIQLRWRGQTLEAVNSPTRAYLPAPGSPISFFIRPEYVRLIRKDRGVSDDRHHMNLMSGTLVRQTDFGTTWTLALRLDEPGAPAQGDHDLEVQVPRLVHEMLELEHDRRWQFSIHRGSIQVLPG